MDIKINKFSEIPKGISQMWNSLLEGLKNRLDLFVIELKEEKEKLIYVLIGIIVAIFALFMAFLCCNLLLVLIFWDHRIMIAIILSGFYLTLAASFALWAKHYMFMTKEPFSATLNQFKKDKELRGSAS